MTCSQRVSSLPPHISSARRTRGEAPPPVLHQRSRSSTHSLHRIPRTPVQEVRPELPDAILDAFDNDPHDRATREQRQHRMMHLMQAQPERAYEDEHEEREVECEEVEERSRAGRDAFVRCVRPGDRGVREVVRYVPLEGVLPFDPGGGGAEGYCDEPVD